MKTEKEIKHKFEEKLHNIYSEYNVGFKNALKWVLRNKSENKNIYNGIKDMKRNEMHFKELYIEDIIYHLITLEIVMDRLTTSQLKHLIEMSGNEIEKRR